jgi:hypothetical protein
MFLVDCSLLSDIFPVDPDQYYYFLISLFRKLAAIVLNKYFAFAGYSVEFKSFYKKRQLGLNLRYR